MSETTVDGILYPMDWGSVYDAGTGTHALTLYRAPSGALVFGCGCVQYSWALDNFHDQPTSVRGRTLNPYSLRVGVDPYGPERTVQQATVNLFADMGVQPGNLQADLVRATASTDSVAPRSRVTSPEAGSTVAGTVVTGATWHPATGTDEWEYTWHVPEDGGTTNILSRASDDTVNVETPGAGIAVSYGGP